MKNINKTVDTSIIHEKGITLSDREKQFLAKSAWSIAKQIKGILKKYPGMTYYEMKKTLEQAHGKVNIDTVRGRMSQLAGSKDAPEAFKDKYGRFPLVKTNEKRLNPETGTNISVYAYNPRYGKPPSNAELLARQKDRGQMDFNEGLFGGGG